MGRPDKFLTFLGLGAAGWLLAALTIRFFGERMFAGNPEKLVAFAAAFVFAPAFTWTAARLSATPLTNMIAPMSVMIMTATFLDAIALTWFPALYGDGDVLAGSAWLLFGVGAFLGFTQLMAKPEEE